MLDGSDFKGHKVKVEKAKFELKGTFDPTKAKDTEAHKKKLSKKKEKQALTAQRRRLLDWDDRPVVKREKHEKVVVIKNLFFVSDIKVITAYTDIKNNFELFLNIVNKNIFKERFWRCQEVKGWSYESTWTVWKC